MSSKRSWAAIIGASALLIVVIFQGYTILRLRRENESLRAEQAAVSRNLTAPAEPDAAAGIDRTQLENERLELVRLRSEIQQLRGGAVAASTESSTAASAPLSPISPSIQARADEARLLAVAAMQGNPAALNQLAALAVAMRSMSPEGQAMIRASIQSAFEMLAREAGTGNAGGLQAIWQASRIAELKGYAIKALGQAAGLGNDEALGPLLEPEKYLLLRSSATSALRPAADAGNERAIQALAATSVDPKQQGLWLLAAQGLEKAAISGNTTAIDSLTTLAAAENEIIRKQAVLALEAAARENQPQAEEALRKLGWR